MDWLITLQKCLEKVECPTLASLQQLLRGLPCSPEQVKPYAVEPDRLPYGRHVLFRSDSVEAIVIHLPAHAATFIHDHGRSFGCARIVEGELLNVMYRSEGYGYVKRTAEQHLHANDLMLAPPNQIHQMVNPTDRPMISLHLYAPPLFRTRTYRLAEEYVLDFVI